MAKNDEDESEEGGGLFEAFEDVQVWKVNIPPEYREEILSAEGNTQAAKERNARITAYSTITVLGIGIAFFNAFLSSLREDGLLLSDIGYGWVESLFLWKFLFMNKLGGGLALISAGGAGTMAELELQSRKKNAEAIWDEFQRRKSEAEVLEARQSPKKTKLGGKRKARMAALSEVMKDKEEKLVPETSPTAEVAGENQAEQETSKSTEKDDEEDGGGGSGIMGSIKSFYDQADSMAAAQARLLNKELEDRGVVEKITDETGLKVIGREAAKELEEKKKEKE